jgi:hypothetical protein
MRRDLCSSIFLPDSLGQRELLVVVDGEDFFEYCLSRFAPSIAGYPVNPALLVRKILIGKFAKGSLRDESETGRCHKKTGAEVESGRR